MAIHECPFPGCGRRLKDESLLKEHIRRRHPDAQQPEDDNKIINEEPKPATKLTIKEKKAALLAKEKELQDELSKFDEKDEEVKLSMNDIVESQRRLNPKYLQDKTGCDNLEDITQLILREENLYYFDDTEDLSIDQIYSVEFLAISHNKLTDVYGISKLPNLIELNINFNLIEDITPLSECLNLEKLYASNNKIKTISGIKTLTKIKYLGLFKNKLSNFDETLQVLAGFPELKELDLEGNPCTRKFTYKYDVLYSVRVEKLDGERINEIDYDLARSFKGEEVKEDTEKREENSATTSALQRPSTAPGRFKKNYADKLKGRCRFGDPNGLSHIPENVNSEKVAELEQEIEALKEKINALEVELEETKGREHILKLENSQLVNQANILKVEANNSYILLDQNQQLKKELQSLKTICSNKDDIKEVKKENFLLHEKILELLKENNELKAKIDKKSAVEEKAKPELPERFTRPKEKLKIMVRQNSAGQDQQQLPSLMKSGQPSPSFRINSGPGVGVSPRVALRKPSLEGKSNLEGKSIDDKLNTSNTSATRSARKIIKVLPQRASSVAKESKEEKKQEEEDEGLDDEIEELLKRNSLQLSTLRSELRNFFFTNEVKDTGNDNQAMADNAQDDDDDDEYEQETRDTSMQVENSMKRPY